MVAMGNIYHTSGYGNRVLTESKKISENQDLKISLFAIDNQQRMKNPNPEILKVINGINFEKIFVNSYVKNPISLIMDLAKIVKSLRGVIAKEKIDIIHAQSTFASFISVIASKGLGTKIIYDMHGVPVEEHIYKGKKISAFIFRRMENYVFNNVSSVICVSKPMLKYVKDTYEFSGVSLLVPCCFDEKVFFQSSELREKVRYKYNLSSKIVLNYTGSISKWANPYKVINYYKELKKHIPNLLLLIVTQNEKEFLGILKKELSDKEYILVSGNQIEVNEYMNASDIGLLFREDHILNRVSFPTKFAEYLGAGLPVMASPNIGHIQEFTNEVDFANEKDTINKQVEKIRKVERNRMEWAFKSSTLAKERLTWDIYIPQINDLYNKLLLEE